MVPPVPRSPHRDIRSQSSKGTGSSSSLSQLTNALIGSLHIHKGSKSARVIKAGKSSSKVYADTRSSSSRRSIRRTSGRNGDNDALGGDPLRARQISIRERGGGRGGDVSAFDHAPVAGVDVQGQQVDRRPATLGAARGDSVTSSFRTLKSKMLGEAPTTAQQRSLKQVIFDYVDDDLEGDDNDTNYYIDEGSEFDDLHDDDYSRRLRALAAAEQDEVAYFSQRGNSYDFKVSHQGVFHPYGRARAIWDCFLLSLMTWMIISTPFELSFRELNMGTRRAILELDYFLDLMFAIDIILNFMTAVEYDGRLHFSYRSIRRYYVSGWLVFDTIWTMPFYALTGTTGADVPDFMSMGMLFKSDLYPLLRMIRLTRISSLPRIRRRLEFSLRISSSSSSLGGFVYTVLALSHLFSCMFAYLAFGDEYHLTLALADRQLEDDSIYSKYIAASYWSMMTIATVGYGDLTVKTNTGRVFSIVAMVIGGGIFAYGISNVVDLFQQLYVEETEHRHKMDQVNAFMHYRALPRKMRDEIRANFFHLRKATRESKTEDLAIVRQMSRTMQSHVADLFCLDMMPTIMPTLAGGNADFIHELYLAMEVKCYLPGEDIIRQDDYGTELYFLFVGHVQVFVGHSKVALFGPNTCFGEFAIMNPRRPRLATIQAVDFCETHCITRQRLLEIVLGHPFVLQSINQLARLKHRKALAVLTDQTSKTRTLIQTLAAVWHTEGVQALLPTETKVEDFPQLQEYPAQPVVPVMSRLSSVRNGLTTGTARRKSVSISVVDPPAQMGAGSMENSAATAASGMSRHRSSIHDGEASASETTAAVSPSNSTGGATVRLRRSTVRISDGTAEGPSKNSISVGGERMGLLLHQMNLMLKRQEKLEHHVAQLVETQAHRGSVHVSYSKASGTVASDGLRARTLITDFTKTNPHEAPM